MKLSFKIIALLTSLFVLPACQAESDNFALLAGHNYEMVVPAQPTQTGEKIEVLEIFWYGCPHCYHFEPELKTWLIDLPEDVEFRRMPGVFRANWVPHAKAFYAAEEMGVFDQVHKALFAGLHKDKARIFSDEEIIDFVAGLGIDKDKFSKTYNSFTVEGKVKQAMQLSRAYGIRGVPSLIINGKYYSSASIAGSFPEMLKVTDALVDKERQKAAGD